MKLAYKSDDLIVNFDRLFILMNSLILKEMTTKEDNKQNKYIFSDQQITNFVDYYHLLKRIHNRLLSEGYIIKDGKISKPENNDGI